MFALACIAFTRQAQLASFGDDSASYLLMARVFSPYAQASEPVRAAFAHETFYPPLFPLLLAWLGAAGDIARAHVAVALTVALCLPLQFVLARRWLGRADAAFLACTLSALLPGMWINAKGILSDPLFALLWLALLVVIALEEAEQRARPWLLALLFGALVLTRTVGFVLVGAWGAWVVCTATGSWRERLLRTLPAAGAVLGYALWVVLRPTEAGDDYLRIIREGGQQVHAAQQPWQLLWSGLAGQLGALHEAWRFSTLVYWIDGAPWRAWLCDALGVLALAGLARRAWRPRVDAWMVIAYTVTIVLWPYPRQMTRFLFPVLFVLPVYVFEVLLAVASAHPRRLAPRHALGAVMLLWLSLALPALMFVHARWRAGEAEGYSAYTEWFRIPDLGEAQRHVRMHMRQRADMDRIHELTAPGDRILSLAAPFIPLLADRFVIAAPPSTLDPAAYRARAASLAPTHFYLSRNYMRENAAAAWEAGTRALAGRGQVLYARGEDDPAQTTTLLLRLEPAALAAP